MTETALNLKEHEFSLRAERAKKNPFRVRPFESAHFPFTDYEVMGEANVPYLVEIRSLTEKINACSCPDYHVNTLGTCKHIEGVLNFILKQGKRKFAQAAKEGSSRIDMFYHPFDAQVRFSLPRAREPVQGALSLLQPYLSANHSLLTDPITSLDSIRRALAEVPGQVRLSPYLVNEIERQRLIKQRESDRKAFLADIAAGKRSMQVLSTKLFPYQEEGMLHLAFKGRALLADEMGLGKTIQAIAACELLRSLGRVKSVLVVAPASLKGEWEEQIAQFSGLSTILVKGSRIERLACYKKEAFFYLVNYEQVRADYDEIQVVLNPDIMVLDEAQRIKNWETKTAWAVKRLKTPYAFVLTGTPIENRIDELYSIMQTIEPKILGPLFKFKQNFYEYDDRGKVTGHRNLKQLQDALAPVVLRRRKREVEEQLPERTVRHYFVKMGDTQTSYYEGYSSQLSRLIHVLKRRPLTPEESRKMQRLLACMRMVADTPYILDQQCQECPKLEELEETLNDLMESGDNKIIIFSEWQRMLYLVRELTQRMELSYAWHTGSVPQAKRREEIRRFKEDPQCKLFLATDSGSTGLNLQVANVVINLDLPWNPAKLEQRIARAWRKNQTRAVQVINFVTENTIEHRMLGTLDAKQAIASAVLDGADPTAFLSNARDDLIRKLEALTQEDEKKPILPKPAEGGDPWIHLKEDLLARFSNRIHLIERYPNHLLIIVDKTDDYLKETVDKLSPLPTEILDFETYSALQKLASAGIVNLDIEGKMVLHHSSALKKRPSKNNIDKAASAYKLAERSSKMATLLKSGGFTLEALPPAKEAFKKGLEVMAALDQQPDEKALALREQQDQPEIFIDALSDWLNKLSEILAKFTLGIV